VLYRFPERLENAGDGTSALQWPSGTHAFGSQPAVDSNPAVNEVLVLPAAMGVEECTRAALLGESSKAMTAAVERGHAVDYRASTIAWIEPRPDAHWLYHRLAALFLEANRRYRFDMLGFADALQYTVYGPQGRFDWHTDLGSSTTSARKLSVSILLNAESEYQGGRLEFFNIARSQDALPAGTAVFFPSYLMHRVSSIARGTRRSLVAWGYGPPFR
jgi:PKHD-type hydroxylase